VYLFGDVSSFVQQAKYGSCIYNVIVTIIFMNYATSVGSHGILSGGLIAWVQTVTTGRRQKEICIGSWARPLSAHGSRNISVF
jgi:hypothetical protein